MGFLILRILGRLPWSRWRGPSPPGRATQSQHKNLVSREGLLKNPCVNIAQSKIRKYSNYKKVPDIVMIAPILLVILGYGVVALKL